MHLLIPIVLLLGIEAVLEEFNPRFEARRDLRLDLNRDGVEDVVLDGQDDEHDLLVCLLSRPSGYEVRVLRKVPLRPRPAGVLPATARDRNRLHAGVPAGQRRRRHADSRRLRHRLDLP